MRFTRLAALAAAGGIGMGLLGIAGPDSAVAATGCAGTDGVSQGPTATRLVQHVYNPLNAAPVAGVGVHSSSKPVETWVCLGSNPFDTGGGLAVYDLDPSRPGLQVRLAACVQGACGPLVDFTGAEIDPSLPITLPTRVCINPSSCGPVLDGGVNTGQRIATLYVNGVATDIMLP